MVDVLQDPDANILPYVIGGAIGGFIVALIISFKATENFKLGVFAATAGIMLVYLASFVLGLASENLCNSVACSP